MKASLILGILLIGIGLNAQYDPKPQTSRTDESEIKRVIKAESIAFYQRDYDALAKTWTQNENSVVAWNGKDGGYTHMRGWEEIGAYYKQNIENNKSVTYPDFKISDLAIDISGNFAYVVYNEYVANKTMLYSKVPGVKTLIKKDGDWKLHSIISFWDRNYQYSKEQVDHMMKESK